MKEPGNLRDLPRQNGAAIRALRKLNGMASTEDLAEAVGLHPQAVRNLENESEQGSWDALARIARALCVPPAAITRWPPTLEPAGASSAENADIAA